MDSLQSQIVSPQSTKEEIEMLSTNIKNIRIWEKLKEMNGSECNCFEIVNSRVAILLERIPLVLLKTVWNGFDYSVQFYNVKE